MAWANMVGVGNVVGVFRVLSGVAGTTLYEVILYATTLKHNSTPKCLKDGSYPWSNCTTYLV